MNIYDSRTEAVRHSRRKSTSSAYRYTSAAQRWTSDSAALRYRYTIAGAAQRSDNYLDYRSAAQRMCERTITVTLPFWSIDWLIDTSTVVYSVCSSERHSTRPIEFVIFFIQHYIVNKGVIVTSSIRFLTIYNHSKRPVTEVSVKFMHVLQCALSDDTICNYLTCVQQVARKEAARCFVSVSS